jgi:hypothetical protein
VKLHFFTNLDEAQRYVHPLNAPTGEGTKWMGDVPVIGHDILFRVHDKFSFRLRVIAVTWSDRGQEARVELHMPPSPHSSIKEWMEWFERCRRAD